MRVRGGCVYTSERYVTIHLSSRFSLPLNLSADASYAYMREYTSPRKRSREKHRALTSTDTLYTDES